MNQGVQELMSTAIDLLMSLSRLVQKFVINKSEQYHLDTVKAWKGAVPSRLVSYGVILQFGITFESTKVPAFAPCHIFFFVLSIITSCMHVADDGSSRDNSGMLLKTGTTRTRINYTNDTNYRKS